MDDLGRAVRGEWFEINEALDDPYAMEDVFAYSSVELKALAADLRGAVEGGVAEYKLTLLSRFFTFMETLKYDSKGFNSLLSHAEDIRRLTYVMLFQRYITLGKIGSKKTSPRTDPARERAEQLDLKEIIADVNKRLQGDPSLKANPSVKNILMQIQIYRRELAEMHKMMPNIQKEKLPSFKANYQDRFDEIVGKVRNNYANLTREELEAEARMQTDLTPLQRYNLTALASIYLTQAQEASTIHATVAYSVRERYKIRETLTGLMPRKELFNTLLKRETDAFRNMEGDSPGPDSLSRAFISELSRIFTRQADRGV